MGVNLRRGCRRIGLQREPEEVPQRARASEGVHDRAVEAEDELTQGGDGGGGHGVHSRRPTSTTRVKRHTARTCRPRHDAAAAVIHGSGIHGDIEVQQVGEEDRESVSSGGIVEQRDCGA